MLSFGEVHILDLFLHLESRFSRIFKDGLLGLVNINTTVHLRLQTSYLTYIERLGRRDNLLTKSLLFFLFDIFDAHEGDLAAFRVLQVNLCGQSSTVLDFQKLSILLTEDDIAEVNDRLLD